jgi:hypothetical protein
MLDADTLQFKINVKDRAGYIVENGSSPRAKHTRGYHDYLRTVTFWGYQEDFIKEFLAADQAKEKTDLMNMWCGEYKKIESQDPRLVTYQLNYGYDSGD